MSLATVDSQLETVNDALEFAFSFADKDMIRIAAMQSGSNSTNKDIPSHWDKLAYAALILKSLKQLSLYGRHSIELHLSRSSSIVEERANWMGERVAVDLGLPKWFVIDVCRDWSRFGRKRKKYKEWELNLGLGRTSLFYRKIKIQNCLDKWEGHGLVEAEQYLLDTGMITKKY